MNTLFSCVLLALQCQYGKILTHYWFSNLASYLWWLTNYPRILGHWGWQIRIGLSIWGKSTRVVRFWTKTGKIYLHPIQILLVVSAVNFLKLLFTASTYSLTSTYLCPNPTVFQCKCFRQNSHLSLDQGSQLKLVSSIPCLHCVLSWKRWVLRIKSGN